MKREKKEKKLSHVIESKQSLFVSIHQTLLVAQTRYVKIVVYFTGSSLQARKQMLPGGKKKQQQQIKRLNVL